MNEASHTRLAAAMPRWMRISYVVFGLTFIVFGALRLLNGDEPFLGVTQLMIGIGWLMVAAFKGRRSASHSQSQRHTA